MLFDAYFLIGINMNFKKKLPQLVTEKEVNKRIFDMKNITTSVARDIPKSLLRQNLDSLPIAAIFNSTTASKTWPKRWKIENVTVIPKSSDSCQPSQCSYKHIVHELFILYDWCLRRLKSGCDTYFRRLQ